MQLVSDSQHHRGSWLRGGFCRLRIVFEPYHHCAQRADIHRCVYGHADAGGNQLRHRQRQPFHGEAGGNISATITKLSPLTTITVGLGLGVFDASTSTCTLQLFADSAKINVVLSASVGVPGEICVGVYHVGNVTDSVDYEVSITHT